MPPSIHASCVLIGETGVLIRGPSGAGKSRLALALILAARSGVIAPTVLVADDRVRLRAVAGRLFAAPPDELAGLIEIYGVGIRHLPFARSATIGLVVDLAAPEAARMPPSGALAVELEGVTVPRLPVAPGHDALLPLVGLLLSQAVSP